MRARASAVVLACIGVALVLGAVARSAAGPAPSFAAAKSYALGKGSSAITLVDLNGDGKPDVAAPHHDASTVTVLFNRGNGRFAARATYGTGAHPEELDEADLNGDGKPDVVTANTTSVSVLLNRSDGTLQARRDYPTGKLGSLAIHDLNGDGKPDLVITSGTNTVSVFLNTGNGSFQPRSDYATDGPGPVSIAELNGDGYLDLVTASGKDNTLSVFLNRGDGSYESRRDFAIGSAGFSVEIAIADLNGDGRPDIVTANVDVGPGPDSSSLSVLLNDGHGGFETRHDYQTGPSSEFGAVAIRDLNGDGSPDLIACPSEFGLPGFEVAVFLNHGDGTFAPRRNYDVTGGGGLPVYLLDVVDLNGDHSPDLVLDSWGVPASGGFGFAVRLSRGDGSFGRKRLYRTGLAGDGTIGDLNGDGKPELVVTRDLLDGSVASVFLNRGAGSFQPPLDYPTPGEGVDVADVNGDGRPDLVTSSASVLSVLINQPGLCNVQRITGMTLATAKSKLGRANCRVGKISRAYSKRVRRGRIVSQKPKFGAVLRGGGKVSLIVSKGRK
jgi:hypothetical protein